jgi:hypothetical protein
VRVAFASPEDLDYLAREDRHVGRDVIGEKIAGYSQLAVVAC